MSTGFLPTPAWRSARALLNKPLGDIVDDFVAGLYNSAAMKCDAQLAVDPDTDRNAILLLKGISLGCLGFVLDAAHAAADILVDLNATSSVRTWLYCGPQLRALIPIEVIVAFNRLVGPMLVKSQPFGPIEKPSEPTLADRVVAAHPWKFWGECPGGIRPWRPVVLSPTQFHRTPRAHKQVTAILSPKVDTEEPYMSELRALGDTEHLSFSTSLFRGPSKVKVLTDCVKPGDAGMSDLFTAFEAMNFSPVKAMRRKAGKA